jgi:hypothetical protein
MLLPIIVTACGSGGKKTDEPSAWRALFNGKDLSGWVQRRRGAWSVEDGTIVGRWNPDNPGGGWLVTEEEFADFNLRLKFKIGGGGNSGVCIRDISHGNEDPAYFGYEIQIGNRPDSKDPTGCIYDLARAWGDLAVDDDWNLMEISARGDHIITRINGKKGAEVHDRRSLKGVVGMQCHDRRAPVYFKDIEIQTFPSQADLWPSVEDRFVHYRVPWVELFDGKSLAGWTRLGGGRWTVEKGELVGRWRGERGGWLIHERELEDFYLSLKFKVSKDGNSGVCIRFPYPKTDEDRKKDPAFTGYIPTTQP